MRARTDEGGIRSPPATFNCWDRRAAIFGSMNRRRRRARSFFAIVVVVAVAARAPWRASALLCRRCLWRAPAD